MKLEAGGKLREANQKLRGVVKKIVEARIQLTKGLEALWNIPKE